MRVATVLNSSRVSSMCDTVFPSFLTPLNHRLSYEKTISRIPISPRSMAVLPITSCYTSASIQVVPATDTY